MMIKGKTLKEASEIKNTTIAKELSLPPVKLHCSSKIACLPYIIIGVLNNHIVLAEDAINAAVKDYHAQRLLVREGDKAIVV